MSASQQKINTPTSLKQNETNIQQVKQEQQQKLNHKAFNIDSVIRPIIENVESNISQQFLSLHNKYLLQSYQRKAQCYEKNLLPENRAQEIRKPIQKKGNKSKSIEHPSVAIIPTQQFYKPSSDKLLDYYRCFDQQISTSTTRYQKLYKKTEQNKLRLVQCVQKCSGNSKQQNQLFESCSSQCRQTYSENISKLYSNFYTKFLDKE